MVSEAATFKAKDGNTYVLILVLVEDGLGVSRRLIKN